MVVSARPCRPWRPSRPWRRRRDVRPDAVGQGAEDLLDPQRVAARVGLELLVLEPVQRRGVEALAQDDLLRRQRRSPAQENVDVASVRLAAPVDTPLLGAEAAEQGRARTGTTCRSRSRRPGTSGSRAAWRPRRGRSGRGRPCRPCGGGPPTGRPRTARRAPRRRPTGPGGSGRRGGRRVQALAVPDHLGVELLHQLLGQRDPVLGEPARVGAEVPAVDLRVAVGVDVLVRGVGQAPPRGRGRRSSSAFLVLVAVDLLVGVLDGPVVVQADRRRR